MKHKLLVLVLTMAGVNAYGQQLQSDYVQWPSSNGLNEYVKSWNSGADLIAGWEDENFFISRVKPKQHIRNQATQVYPEITAENDKRLIWWVPCGNASLKGVHTDALPNGVMDSEVFSMWSYVTHFGDWISPYGWVPASLADVAHKNGVAVTGVASVPYGAISEEWRATLYGMSRLAAEDVAKFLYYHGVDGLGYNSEFSAFGSKNLTNLMSVHEGVMDWMATRNPIYENMWYAGTIDAGSIVFDIGLNDRNCGLFKGSSFFLNYNWNRETTMQSSVAYAQEMGRDPLCLYAGINMQGGEPNANNWPLLKKYPYSIGLWGAHEVNMFWQGRNSNGSSASAMQNTYLNTCEQWFSNGPRNPAVRKEIKSYSSYAPHENFHGMSSMMTARSALGWDIADEPFYTYFNLGNGTFFNWKGERVMDNEWYNIGVQDYLPTWRFWFAPSFLANDINADDVKLNARFTWDQAYVGGSCLNIKGTADTEYLHLFKTDFKVAAGDVITLRYKLLEGAANMRLVFAKVGDEQNAIDDGRFDALTTERTAEVLKQSHAAGGAGWVTEQYTLTDADVAAIGNIAVIALKFTDAKDMSLYLGELSITAAGETTTPDVPVIDKAKMLCNNYQGIDGKVIFHMPGEKAKPEPTYNADVNVSMFRLWAQEENGEVQCVGATTSWAGLCYRIRSSADDSRRVRLGVSAVAMDMKSESEIAWSEWMEKQEYVSSDEFAIDKTTIKPNQAFSIGYIDARHSESTWTIYDLKGTKMVEDTGVALNVEAGLPEVGGYDLVVDEGTENERRLSSYVQITGTHVGAYPEITGLTVGGESAETPVEIEIATDVELGYTGSPSNGEASRGLALNEKMVGAYNNQVGIAGGESFSVCVWLRLDEMPNATWDLFNICNRSGGWPMNNWGWCWVKAGSDGTFGVRFRNLNVSTNSQELQYTMPTACIQPKVWTHLAFVFEYGKNGEGFRSRLYINGIKQESTWIAHTSGNSGGGRGTGTTDTYCASQNLPLASTDMILFGGTAYQGAAAKGSVDDFQIWKKALDEDDVKLAMTGFPDGNIPAELVGLWSFEDEPDDKGNFFSTGSVKTIPAYHFSYEATQDSGEGQGGRKIEQPIFVGGSPFLAGTAFPVRTQPTWTADNYLTTFSEATGTDVAGSSKVRFGEKGDQTVRLTLTNSWGSDSRDYPVFVVKDKLDGVDVADAAAEKVYAVDGTLFVQFGAAGNYTVTVATLAGATMASKTAVVRAGESMRVRLSAPGAYVVAIDKDGERTRTIKVVNK
ncbi:MAG: secretion protein [Bacteroidaceae bacterium]|nr:secretion protein [Bacteroidaceae bacterium]